MHKTFTFRYFVLCAITQMQTESMDCHLDSQDSFFGLLDGDLRRATPLEVPIVLFVDLQLIHDLVAST
jgi:hypothetical protein